MCKKYREFKYIVMLIRQGLVECVYNKNPCASQEQNLHGGLSYILEWSHDNQGGFTMTCYMQPTDVDW